MTSNRFIIPALILGLAAVVSMFIFTGTWRKVRSENQTITVTGSAKKVMISDLGILRGTLSASGATASDAYRALQA
ncbi:MAG TPA: hypothetical protein VLZ28_04115, partial [Daejeonella sp.]|nr:hypothetical protein [Daejeonella sp.]